MQPQHRGRKVHFKSDFIPHAPLQSMLSQDFDDDEMPNVVWVDSPKADPHQGSQQVFDIV